MKLKKWVLIFLACAFCVIPGCGGGDNVVSNQINGTLSIEQVSAPTSASGQGFVAVKLIAPTGGPGKGTVAITASNSSLVTFSPGSQAVNANGEATFFYTAAAVEESTVVPFTVAVETLSLTSQLAIPGTGTLTLVITAPPSADTAGSITASFASGAHAAGKKIALSSDTTTNVAIDTAELPADASGKAVFSYRVINITADTTITFTAKSDAQTVSKSILIPLITTTPPEVINPQVNSLAFVSASPISISLKGTGGFGRTETSIVSFIVRDVTGQPLPGQIVDFTLDTSVGGITLVPISATSDSVGVVRTIVNAGVVSTPVRVTATIRNKPISTKSDQLIISTGLPHQDGLSISSATLNPEAWNFDGVEVPVTAMMSDHFGNPVPDGTAVYFMAYGGSIEANATTKNGIATVKWRSQNPRPSDGKAKILVYAIGEESFTDLNGNGLADLGEFADMPEAYLEIDGDGKFTCGVDSFVNFNTINPDIICTSYNTGDGKLNGVLQGYNTGDGKFNGVLQGDESKGALTSLHVFKNYQIVMSGSKAKIQYVTDNNGTQIKPDATTGSALINIFPGDGITNNPVGTNIAISISDENNSALPFGSKIDLSSSITGLCNTGYIVSNFGQSTGSFTQNNGISQSIFSTNIRNTCSNTADKPSRGMITVTVTSPKGIETKLFINITY